jgi:hypothetical protein
MERKLPRPFSMPWGNGMVVEEASFEAEWHEPTIQLLEYEDGSQSVRFCSYNHGGTFQRSPLMVGAAEIKGLRKALAGSPRLKKLLTELVK